MLSPRLLTAISLLVILLSTSMDAQQQEPRSCFQLEESTDFDFGSIAQSDTVSHTFIFRNGCADTVTIASARSSCGCTAVVLSEKIIPPGETARIQATFTPPRGSRDRVRKSVSVYLSGDDTAHTVLRVSARVRSDIALDPSYIKIPDARAGKQVTVQSTVHNISDRTLLVETTGVSLISYPAYPQQAGKAKLPLSGGSVSPTQLTLAPDERADFTITFIPEWEGQINGSLGLRIGENESIIFMFADVAAQGAR
ncbi:DUF1573 domain-containing protein [bacterium]|nr:DUF1573 domain-containing protein [bacterium]